MANEQFDLGEALGGYEQAKADREFYLSMMQQGNRNQGAFMMSPIAAYLAGVSGVKMANMRAKAQEVEDARQAEKDAIVAADKARAHKTALENQIVGIMKGAREGTIAPGVAASLIGPLTKELGYTLKSYDADNNKAIYNVPGDPEDYEWDFGPSTSTLEEGRNKRAQDRLAWEKEKQERGIQGQIRVAEAKKNLGIGGGAGQKQATFASYKSANPKAFKLAGGELLLEDMTKQEVDSLVEGAEALSDADRELAESTVIPVVLDWAKKNHPEWLSDEQQTAEEKPKEQAKSSLFTRLFGE
jgi:hypothetical protein